MKQVSVIIPNYNHAPFLHKRIESVLNQTYHNIEVIILDDCSTDNSREIIELYRQHPKVKQILLNNINSGSPFIQWEKAFAFAEGEIIWVAESDDYAEFNFLEKLIPLFSEEIGVVYCDSNVNDAENTLHRDFYKKFRNERFKTEKWNNDYQKDGISELRENLFFECTINNMSAVLFKKDLLQCVNWTFLKTFRYCGDWFFLVSITANTKIAYLSIALNYFKYGGDNFKKGTKSVVNYFKERFMVRYFFWNKLERVLSQPEKSQLIHQLASEMRVQITSMVKGNSNTAATINSFLYLKKINGNLFKKQLGVALRSYLWKSSKF